MRALLVALCAIVAPGFAQGLMRQRAAQWIAFGAAAVVVPLTAVTVWALPLAVIVFLATATDAFRRYRRLRPHIKWSWRDALLAVVAGIALQVGLRTFVVEAFKAPSSSMIPTIQIGDHFFINKLATSPDRGDVIVFRHPCDNLDFFKRVIALGGDTLEIRCAVVYVNGKPLARALVEAESPYDDVDHRGEWFIKDASRYRETTPDGKSYEILQERREPGHPDGKDFPVGTIRSCANSETLTGPPGTTGQPTGSIVVTAPPDETDACKLSSHFVVPAGTVFVMGDNRPNSNDSRYWGVVPVDNIRGTLTGIWYPFSRFGGAH